MKGTKVLSSMLVLCLLLALLPAGAISAPAADAPWDGSGTEADPWRILTAEDLRALADGVNGGESYDDCFFALRQDIDLGGAEWTPIGYGVDYPFRGTLLGRGHSITGLLDIINNDYNGDNPS